MLLGSFDAAWWDVTQALEIERVLKDLLISVKS